MPEIIHAGLMPSSEVVRRSPARRAPNGVRYASYGDTQFAEGELEAIVQAPPRSIAAALERRSYYFVPLVLTDPDEDSDKARLGETPAEKVLIAPGYSAEWSDQAVCHRNAAVIGAEYTFISVRLMQDRFAVAFEFYINAAHHFIEKAGVPESFMRLVWSQAESGVRGETSQDAWEYRLNALGEPGAGSSGSRTSIRARRLRAASRQTEQTSVQRPIDEKARVDYLRAAFADAMAIYLLSLALDFEYSELREREYPLLAAPALAERLRHVAQIFPPDAGVEFSIRYGRD
jgi:hypothetical protein